MFGWLNSWLERAKRNGASIHSLAELVQLVKEESAKQRSADPTAKVVYESDKPPPGKRLLATNLHITRTYCVGSQLANPKFWRLGVKITNFIFSAQHAGIDLTTELWVENTEAPGDWRRGFYGSGESSWNTNPLPLDLHQETALTKRQGAQQHLLGSAWLLRHRAPLTREELAKKKETFLERRRQQKQRRENRTSGEAAVSNSSGSSSSSSTSTTSSEEDNDASNF